MKHFRQPILLVFLLTSVLIQGCRHGSRDRSKTPLSQMAPVKLEEPPIAPLDSTHRVSRLLWPVRIATAGEYQDGGTVYCVLVDARGDSMAGGFAGYMDRYGGFYPRHCFAGAVYPRFPGARLLPLWGPDERGFVSMIHSILIQGLTPAEVETMSVKRWPLGPRTIKGDTGSLAAETERRYRTLMAMDRGYLADPRDAYSYFEFTAPVRLASPIARNKEGGFLVSVKDRTGKKVVLTFPSESNPLGPSISSGKGFRNSNLIGTNEDRLNLAVAMSVLGATSSHSTRAAHALQASLASRCARILEDDRSR